MNHCWSYVTLGNYHQTALPIMCSTVSLTRCSGLLGVLKVIRGSKPDGMAYIPRSSQIDLVGVRYATLYGVFDSKLGTYRNKLLDLANFFVWHCICVSKYRAGWELSSRVTISLTNSRDCGGHCCPRWHMVYYKSI